MLYARSESRSLACIMCVRWRASVLDLVFVFTYSTILSVTEGLVGLMTPTFSFPSSGRRELEKSILLESSLLARFVGSNSTIRHCRQTQCRLLTWQPMALIVMTLVIGCVAWSVDDAARVTSLSLSLCVCV